MQKLNELVDWKLDTRKLIRLYQGGGVVGRPPFDPAMLLKVELLAYLYRLSEWQVETYRNENLPAKSFVGLTVDEKVPDHSTLIVFRERLVQRGKLSVFDLRLKDFIPDDDTLFIEFNALVDSRNDAKASVDWQFRTKDARIKLKSLYPSISD